MTKKTIVVGHHPGKTLDSMPIECCGKLSREDIVKAGDTVTQIAKETETRLLSIFPWADVQVVFNPNVFAPFRIWAAVVCRLAGTRCNSVNKGTKAEKLLVEYNIRECFHVDISYTVSEILSGDNKMIHGVSGQMIDGAINFLLENNRPHQG